MKKILFCSIIIFILFFSVEVKAYTDTKNWNLLISAIVSGPPDPTNPPSVGGGGGGYSVPTSITFSGKAYPLSKVSLLQDGQLIMTTIAGPDSKFTITLNNNLSGGNYLFSISGEDSAGRKSTLFTIPLFITQNTSTTISGIFITPTIAVDKLQVAQGDNLTIFGQSVPSSNIVISIHSPVEIFKNVNSDSNGVYLLNFDTSPLIYGQHQAKSKVSVQNEISTFSPIVTFNVGSTNIMNKETMGCGIKADLNGDCKVNLVDFSILAYWYKRAGFPKKIDLNNDGKINIIDFSIMAYYWTG